MNMGYEDTLIIKLHANFELDRSMHVRKWAKHVHTRNISHISSNLRQKWWKQKIENSQKFLGFRSVQMRTGAINTCLHNHLSKVIHAQYHERQQLTNEHKQQLMELTMCKCLIFLGQASPSPNCSFSWIFHPTLEVKNFTPSVQIN